MTTGACLGNVEISCGLLPTSNLLFNIVVADVGISLWNLCLGIVNIPVVDCVAEVDLLLRDKIPFRLMWVLDFGWRLGIFVDVWETFSIETESAERIVTDVNVWTFDIEVYIISSHITLGHTLKFMTLNMLLGRTTGKTLRFETEIMQLTSHVRIGKSPAVLSHWAFFLWNVHLLLTSICLLSDSLILLSLVLLGYSGQKHRIMLSSLCDALWQILRASFKKDSGCDRALWWWHRQPLLIWW